MIVANNPETLRKLLQDRPVRLALGNFDGLHLGHRQLIENMVKTSLENREGSVVMTFSPHPAQYFARNQDFRKIDTPAIQQAILSELGVTALLELKFDDDLAAMTGQEFVDAFIAPLGVKEIFVGEDFRFGRGRSSGLEGLKLLGAKTGFAVSVVKTLESDGAAVSSSRLRQLIAQDGDMELAAKFLSRPYCLEGVVGNGNKLGRTIGFPTANLEGIVQVIPKTGVYAGVMLIADSMNKQEPCPARDLPCVINVGVRPTVTDKSKVTVEAHVYGPFGDSLDIYGRKVFLKFFSRIRDERRFESVDDLKKQISKDIETAQKLLRH